MSIEYFFLFLWPNVCLYSFNSLNIILSHKHVHVHTIRFFKVKALNVVNHEYDAWLYNFNSFKSILYFIHNVGFFKIKPSLKGDAGFRRMTLVFCRNVKTTNVKGWEFWVELRCRLWMFSAWSHQMLPLALISLVFHTYSLSLTLCCRCESKDRGGWQQRWDIQGHLYPSDRRYVCADAQVWRKSCSWVPSQSSGGSCCWHLQNQSIRTWSGRTRYRIVDQLFSLNTRIHIWTCLVTGKAHFCSSNGTFYYYRCGHNSYQIVADKGWI